MYIQSLSYFMLICTLVHVSGFSSSISRQSISNRKTYLKMNFPQKYITDIGKVCAIVALPLSLTFSDFGTLFDNSHVLTIKAANADVRAQQKRTYFRFVPKLKTGLTFYATELKEAVDNEDYKKISSIFDEFVYKQHKTDSELDQMETYVNLNFFRPMKVFAGTFAERGTSQKTTALLEQESIFEQAMTDLEGSTRDLKGKGFFAPDIKMPVGEARKKQAQESWEKGKKALNEYITIANTGLMLELNKIDTI